MNKKISLLISILPILIVFYFAFPFFTHYFIPTHDGEYHIIRFWQFYENLKYGILFPKWAPDLNSTFGIPLFQFYYPLTNYFGSFLYLFTRSFVNSFKFEIALLYLLSFFGSYLWIKSFKVNNITALYASLIGSLTPYWFVDIYIRGSIGEVLAITIFVYILYFWENNKFTLLSVFIFLLILSHNILGLLFTICILLLSLVYSKRALLYIFLGIFLSTFFWLPAIGETKYISTLSPVDPNEHFTSLYQYLIPSWGSGFSKLGTTGDEMSQAFGIFQLIIFFYSLYIYIKNKDSYKKYKYINFYLLTIIIISFLLNSISKIIWQILPGITLIQYPWRLLSFEIPAITYLAYIFLSNVKNTFNIVFIVTLIIFSIYLYKPVLYEARDDNYYLTKENFIYSTSSLGNSFSTIWLPYQKTKPENKIISDTENDKITINKIIPNYYSFTTSFSHENRIKINTSYFPGWNAYINGKKGEIDYKSGIIEFTIPEGNNNISVQLEETYLRIAADTISLVSLIILIIIII